MDLTYVYSQDNHALVHKWIALCNPESKDFQIIRGHIKLGISVQAEGDDDVDLTVKEIEDSKDNQMLLPPQISLEPYQLTVSLLKAEGLPKLDFAGTIDAFIEVEFGGFKIKSSAKTADKVRKSVYWYENLFLPMMLPNPCTQVLISLYDKDLLTNEPAGSISFDLKRVEKNELNNYFWVDLYGAPEGFDNNHAKIMNKFPLVASSWHGRILLKIEFKKDPKPKLDCEGITDKKIGDYTRANYEAIEEYEIRCLVYAGVGLSPKFNEYSIAIYWAGAFEDTNFVPVTNQMCKWYEKNLKRIMKLPKGSNKLSDIFVYLKTKDYNVCFARLDPKDFNDVMAEPKWIRLTVDQAVGKIDNEWESGYVQLRIYCGKYTGKEDDKIGKWHLPPSIVPAKKLKKYKLLFNLYQCRELPAADSDGHSDPYLEVYCNGTTVKSGIIYNTLNPSWYSVLELDVELSSIYDSPPVIVRVMDKDDITSDDLIGIYTYFVRDADVDSSKPATPAWKQLGLGKCFGGSLLASMNLYTDPVNYPKYSIIPECFEATVEINCLGLRDLTPAVGWLPVNKAFIKFDVNSLQIPSEKLLIQNIQTQPGESGPNPTINTIIRFNFSMPVDKTFSPVLSCIVYDNLFKGLSQPQIGAFSIDLRKIYDRKHENIAKAVSKRYKLEDVELNIEQNSKSTDNNLSVVKVVPRPSIEDARKGGFVIKPSFFKDPTGKTREVARPGLPFMKLGYNRNPDDDIMHYRYSVEDDLENTEYIDKTAFETFSIKKGQERGEDSWISSIFSKKKPDQAVPESTVKFTGMFKGLVRVNKTTRLEKKDQKVQELKEKRNYDDDLLLLLDDYHEDFNDIRKLLLKKTQVVVRIYIIQCLNLSQKDLKSNSDPYVKIKLAGKVINDVKNYQLDQPNPKILKNFDILATLPGACRLKIQLWDKDEILKDDKIGETIIDLEDRYFSNKWQRLKEKPIEKRQLYHKSTKLSQGVIYLWVEMYRPGELPPPLDITEKPPVQFEARLIVWQTSDVANYDTEATSDLYVRAAVNDAKPKETDTHYRCQNGKGQFNWRMVFHLTLPAPSCLITLQIWDRDMLSANDFIADACISFNKLAEECFEQEKRIKMKGGKDLLLKMVKKTDPDDFWVECKRRKDDGSFEYAGKILISFELLPLSEAEKCPVGEGRSQPNVDPFLPEPQGRFQWSLNPFKLINQTCGPEFRCKICCAICCVICTYLAIMIGPSLIGTLIGRA